MVIGQDANQMNQWCFKNDILDGGDGKGSLSPADDDMADDGCAQINHMTAGRE